MDLKQLQFFIAVAERLNFSRAAEAMYISQPALSYQIAELERELGVELFYRDRRKVSLTPVGAALLPRAREALEATENIRLCAQQAAGGEQTAETGLLRVGFENTEDHFECTGITEVLAQFMERFPRMRLEMRQAPFADCMELLLDGSLDVAFVILHHNAGLDPGLAGLAVRRDRLMLVFRDEEGEALNSCEEVMARFDLALVSGKPRGHARILSSVSGFTPRIRTVDSLPAAFTLTQAGLAATVLPGNYFWRHSYAGLKGVEIPGNAAVITHYAVWNKNTSSPLALGLVEEFRLRGILPRVQSGQSAQG